MINDKKNRLMPLLMAISVVVGIVIGSFYANHFSGNRLTVINNGSNRLNNLLRIIDDQYVDKVDIDSLVEKAIPQILAELDPHSVYISAKDVQAADDDLRGSFSGVGIEFTIREDTIHVQNVIKNGPAEKAGILAGDKIVYVDGKKFVGPQVTNEEAMHRLKGEQGSKVKLGVLRYGHVKPITYEVTRGEIPTKTITAAYMLDDNTGYIKGKNFGEKTYPELLMRASPVWSLTSVTTRAAICKVRFRWPMSSCLARSSLSIPKDASRLARNIVRTGMALIRTSRWWCSSMRGRLLHRRYSPEPCRTTTGQQSSAAAHLARALCSSRFLSPTVA